MTRFRDDSFGRMKAGGLDGIKPILLQNLDQYSLGRLQTLYKASVALGHVPKNWCESKVIFMPKPGKQV